MTRALREVPLVAIGFGSGLATGAMLAGATGMLVFVGSGLVIAGSVFLFVFKERAP
jgi:hypothetical protein